MTSVTRKLGRLAAVGAVALLLAGAWAASAATTPMVPRSRIANALANYCSLLGGDPAHVQFMGVWGVGCKVASGYVAVWVGDD
jgi:hypothetical protein